MGVRISASGKPLIPILGITSTLYAYEDGMASKFRKVGTKSSHARRLPQKKHNTTDKLLTKVHPRKQVQK